MGLPTFLVGLGLSSDVIKILETVDVKKVFLQPFGKEKGGSMKNNVWGLSMFSLALYSTYRAVSHLAFTYNNNRICRQVLSLVTGGRVDATVCDHPDVIRVGGSNLPRISGGNGTVVVSPSLRYKTSTMHVLHLVIPPMSELVEKEAQGMEVYFVLSGAGVFRTESGENNGITAHEAFTCDPKKSRYIKNPNRASPLVLLRYSDGGKIYDEKANHDEIRRLETKRRNTMEFMMDGLGAVGRKFSGAGVIEE